jgi:hypothetical protein
VIQRRVDEGSGYKKTVYSPVVTYAYPFGGRHYASESLTLLGTPGPLSSEELAWEFLKSFPIGGAVTVFVNPDSPDESVLIPGVHWSQYAGFAFITLLFGGFAFIGEIIELFS